MHNLTIEGLHTYHVVAGNAPILVHNCGFFKKWLSKGEPALPEANATVRDLQGMHLPDFEPGGWKDRLARTF